MKKRKKIWKKNITKKSFKMKFLMPINKPSWSNNLILLRRRKKRKKLWSITLKKPKKKLNTKLNKRESRMKRKKNSPDSEKCKRRLMIDNPNLMPWEPKELKNKMKEMPEPRKRMKLNTENKLMMSSWMPEDNNSTRKNKDSKNKPNSKEMSSKELSRPKNKKEKSKSNSNKKRRNLSRSTLNNSENRSPRMRRDKSKDKETDSRKERKSRITLKIRNPYSKISRRKNSILLTSWAFPKNTLPNFQEKRSISEDLSTFYTNPNIFNT